MKILSRLKRIYNHIPGKNIKLLYPFIYIYRKLKEIWRPVYIWNGKSKQNGLSLCVAYIGNSKIYREYYISIMFKSGVETTCINNRFLFGIIRLLKQKQPDCSVILWEHSSITKWYLQKKQKFVIPFWIRTEIDISQPIKQLERKRKKYREMANLIRKQEYTCESSDKIDDFTDFYYNMYVPYANYRHGETASVLEYSVVFDPESKHELFLLKKHSEVLGGVVVKYKNRSAKMSFFGIKKEHLSKTEEGFLGALYYFIIQSLQIKGYRKMSIGDSHPFIFDGVTRFKLYMLAQLEHGVKYREDRNTTMLILNVSKGIADFLKYNPFVYFSRNSELTGAIWIEDKNIENEKEIQTSFKMMERIGVKYCFVNNLNVKNHILRKEDFKDSAMVVSIYNANEYIVNT